MNQILSFLGSRSILSSGLHYDMISCRREAQGYISEIAFDGSLGRSIHQSEEARTSGGSRDRWKTSARRGNRDRVMSVIAGIITGSRHGFESGNTVEPPVRRATEESHRPRHEHGLSYPHILLVRSFLTG